MSDLTEATLIQQVLAGNNECYRPLVEKYRAQVYHLAHTLLGNGAEAQDIAQDAFLTAFRELKTLRNAEKFRPWLFGITRNLCRQTLKKRKSAPEYLDDLPEREKPNVVMVRPSDSSGADMLDALRAHLDNLPEKYRVLLCLKYLEDYSYTDIAEMLDLSVDLVRSRLFEGRRMLRKGMTESENINYGV